jgi:environmental stress-induced protein Ves
MSRITVLSPAGYRRMPWKNGGGVTVDIAFDGEVWRFSRTPITTAGPFSDYTGYDRLQVLVAGRGLVLETPDGEIDLRQPFQPARFAGETPITSRLEAGPVEVVNLLGDRALVRLDLAVMVAGDTQRLGPGLHFAYCPAGQAVLRLSGDNHRLAADEALRIEDAEGALATLVAGRVVRGSVACVSR